VTPATYDNGRQRSSRAYLPVRPSVSVEVAHGQASVHTEAVNTLRMLKAPLLRKTRLRALEATLGRVRAAHG
jgi:hypothetical protein